MSAPPPAAADIAIYLPSLRGGGAERVMVTLANAFAARGRAVDLVLVSAQGPYLAEVAEGVRIVDLGARRVAASLPALVAYLRRRRPARMLAALNHANVIAVLARGLARVPTRLVISERNHVSRGGRIGLFSPERALLALMRWTYPHADGVVAVSMGVADDLARAIDLPRARIGVLYNPVLTPALLDRAAARLDHPWFGQDEPPVVLGVGRLTAQKDFPALIQAFARLRSRRPCRLIILGEGELRTELEALVERLGLRADVALPGFVDNPYVWMRRAAMFVLSSAWEGLPNALIQAMACGTRVVSTDCPSGPSEILEQGRWGPLVPVGQIDALADAMSATLDDRNPPDVARRARDFALDHTVDAYLQELQGR